MSTYAELRKDDPAIREIILYAASRNVQKLEIEAIEKILTEGADGRYLQEMSAAERLAITGGIVDMNYPSAGSGS